MKANIDWVTDTLATGGDFDFDPVKALSQIDDILDQDIGYVVDLRDEADDADVWAHFPTVEYNHVPTKDEVDYTIPAHVFDDVVAIAREAEAAGEKILVHCHMGINRGPSGAFAVLLDRGHEAVEAFEMVRKARGEAAIYFAVNALEAHHERQGVSDSAALHERGVLVRHMNSIWTPEEQQRINHIIREKHAFDLRALFPGK